MAKQIDRASAHVSRQISVTAAPGVTHGQDEAIADVTRILDTWFHSHAGRMATHHERISMLVQTMRELTAAGGKKMRPYLSILAYEAYGGGQYNAITHVAAAMEMIHFAMLVHDDVIDRDTVRYGRDNIGGTYRKHYAARAAAMGIDDDTGHYGDVAGILAGDIAIAAAYDLISRSGFTAVRRIGAIQQLSETIFRVTGGELIDTDAKFYPLSETDPLQVASIKTAHYSFTTPLQIGAAMADAPEKELGLLARYGHATGIAFQLADDLLGVFGNEDHTGKSASGDIREGKRTLLLHHVMQAGSDDDRALLERFYGKADVTEEECDIVRQMFISSGARNALQAEIDRLSDESAAYVQQLSVGVGAKTSLLGIIDKATKRQA